MHRWVHAWLSAPLVLGLCSVTFASEVEPSKAIAELIKKGRGDSLAERLQQGRNATEKGFLAQAYANAGRNEKDREQANRFYAQADGYYTQRIELLPKMPLSDLNRLMGLAQTHLDQARLLALRWPAREFEDFRVTNGIRGDREWMSVKFSSAVAACNTAYKHAKQLLDMRSAREDEFLQAGIFDRVGALAMDSVLVRSWARYRLGKVVNDPTLSRSAFGKAEEDFGLLLDRGAGGATVYQCYLGRGLSLRHLGRYDDAEELLKKVAAEGNAALKVQVEFELAMIGIDRKKWKTARALLRPLAEQSVRTLPKEKRAARFYFNLARIAFAYSFFQEASHQAERAQGDRSMLLLARATRERGMSEFRKMGRQGGPWAAVAQVYITESVDLLANPQTLSPTEILYAVREMREETPSKASRWLQSAISRRDVAEDLVPELLFELGVVEHEQQHYRSAAEAFSRVATEFRSSSQAERAAAFAFQLWQRAALDSDSAQDYAELAKAARVILESYPKHELRFAARWALPQALEEAGEFEAAARSYRSISEDSRHWEAAQYRSALMQRRMVEVQRENLSKQKYSVAARAAGAALGVYANEVFARASSHGPRRRAELREWSATARLRGAELLVAANVEAYEEAVSMLAEFETSYPDSDQLGAVLGIRIRALNGLRQFDQAADMVSQFLTQTDPERVGGVLGVLASGMRAEVERLAEQGQPEAAKELARGALPTFEQLATWAKGEGRESYRKVVGVSLARMKYLAGDFEGAEVLVRTWLSEAPNDGNLKRLMAHVLTARVGEAATPADIVAAREAWDAILVVKSLRRDAPAVYWEALYHRMALMLRAGSAEDVHRAIAEQLVWFPEMGGPQWLAKFKQLQAQAAKAAGIDKKQEAAGTDSDAS